MSVNFIRIGSINRSTGELSINKGYEKELKGLTFDLEKIKRLFDSNFQFVIIGDHEENNTERGSGVFLRKSKSGNSLMLH